MWPFKRKPVPKSEVPKIVYKSGQAFFDLQCKYGQATIKERRGVVALVLDAAKEYGTRNAVSIDVDGHQIATVRVASPDGGFTTTAKTASAKGDKLKPGDLVIWVPMTHMKKLADALGHHRKGWIGLIVAKIAAEDDPNTNELTVLCRY